MLHVSCCTFVLLLILPDFCSYVCLVCGGCQCGSLHISDGCLSGPFGQGLSGPNRAMPPRCAMRFESHSPKSLAMREKKSFFFFASDAKTHSLDLNHTKTQEKPSAKILRCWPAMRKIGMFFKIERCEMPADFEAEEEGREEK